MRKGSTGSVYKHVCQCGKCFEAKGANAVYCEECRKERKIRLDHEAWVRRKHRDGKVQYNERRRNEINRLEMLQAKQMHLSWSYYLLWRDSHKEFYREWIASHLPDDLKEPTLKKMRQRQTENAIPSVKPSSGSFLIES